MLDQNFDVYKSKGGGLIKMWTRGVPVERQALQQLENISSLPFIYKWIAVMPDVHFGMGVTVGSVIPTQGAIIPAAVGVDIGCGIDATMTNLVASDLCDLARIRREIEKNVPHGRTNNGGSEDKGAWQEIPLDVYQVWHDHLDDAYEDLCDRHPGIRSRNTINHLGTLGTGNHFIEVCLDEQDRVWLMLHSGSRGPGNRIGTYFIRRAKDMMKKWFINLPDSNLAYLPQDTDLFDDYLRAVMWAQEFALLNRALLMDYVFRGLQEALGSRIDRDVDGNCISCHHNYVAWERHFGRNVLITRKGAIDAHEGKMGIIPGSMGARSFIVRGLGNQDSFKSCSHGAGRVMSRRDARRIFTLEDHCASTRGIECRKDIDVLDETPGAYKDIDAVMAAQSDLVEIVHTFRQVVCVKG